MFIWRCLLLILAQLLFHNYAIEAGNIGNKIQIPVNLHENRSELSDRVSKLEDLRRQQKKEMETLKIKLEEEKEIN